MSISQVIWSLDDKVQLQPAELISEKELEDLLAEHILPIQMSINQYYERQLDRAGLALEQYRAERSAAALDRKEGASKC